MQLGVIADDFTGATDIASFLVENGVRTIQLNGTPGGDLEFDADAVVISLKSRSCPTAQAVSDSLAALQWLQEQGCKQFYFKYCSTFDSTAQGNIGPVTDAMLDALNEEFTVVCPALPVNGRTVFNGHLFVWGELLSESGMKDHPITPMTDSNLVHLMNNQAQGKTGLVNYEVIEQGPDKITESFALHKNQGKRYVVVDTFKTEHLDEIGKATHSLKLVTGGSGLAAGMAKYITRQSQAIEDAQQAGYPSKAPTVIFSGSCSQMTNRQVSDYIKKAPNLAINVEQCLRQNDYDEEIFSWVKNNLDGKFAPMVYATTDAENLKSIQHTYGVDATSHAIENLFSRLAKKLHSFGVRNFIVAGGETSGVVAQSLHLDGFHIGPQITPGVPWVKSINGDLSMALKSGNFGDESFFTVAQKYLL
jgi:3-dehydrotetronate 4-kinase